MLQKGWPSFIFTGLLAFGLSAPSYAATFDFVKNADSVMNFENTHISDTGGEGERGVTSGYLFSQSGDPLVVTLRASVLDDPNTSLFPYFDKNSGGPGGLGVCKVLTGSAQCDPGGDDNTTLNEVLTLDFGTQTVDISNISFSNGTHGTTFVPGSVRHWWISNRC